MDGIGFSPISDRLATLRPTSPFLYARSSSFFERRRSVVEVLLRTLDICMLFLAPTSLRLGPESTALTANLMIGCGINQEACKRVLHGAIVSPPSSSAIVIR